jgi:hypothetical protein
MVDPRDKKLSWEDQDVFDIPEAVGITASRDYLAILRDNLIGKINHLTVVSQMIPESQRDVSVLEMYISTKSEDSRIDKWKNDLITKQYDLDHLKARKENLIISIGAIQTVMESLVWDLKE